MSFLDVNSRDQTTQRWNAAEAVRRNRVERERRAAEARADTERRRAALRDTIEATRDLDLRGFSTASARRLVTALELTHRITTTWTTAQPASARITARHVVAPPITTPESLAVWLHEAGHVLAGPCPKRAPHLDSDGRTLDEKIEDSVRRREGRVRSCVACETAASLKALALAPFSREMHARLAKALQSYLRETPATAAARAHARRFVSEDEWRRALHERVQHQIRMDQYREIMGWL